MSHLPKSYIDNLTSVLHGDLSGGLPTGTVARINGTTIPTTSGGDVGKVLTATGAGAATWQSTSSFTSGVIILPVVDVATSALTISGTAQTTNHGVALNSIGARVYLNSQGNSINNGVWVVQSGAWTRPPEMDTGAHFASSMVVVLTGTGSFYSGTIWANVSANYPSDVVGTNGQSVTQIAVPFGRYVVAASIQSLSSGVAIVDVSGIISGFSFVAGDRLNVCYDSFNGPPGFLKAPLSSRSGHNFTVTSVQSDGTSTNTSDNGTIAWSVTRNFGDS